MAIAFDVLLIALFLLTILSGIHNGFFRELFALLGLVGGLVAAMRLTPELLARIPSPAARSLPVTVLLFVLIFVAGYALLGLIGRAFAAIWEGKDPTGPSRLAGMALAAGRGLALAVFMAGTVVLLAPPASRTLGQSRVLQHLGPGIRWGAGLLPGDIHERLIEKWESLPFEDPAGGGVRV